MNRPGAVPQNLRGMPAGFGGQQQPQQPGRSATNRLPNGKIGNNGGQWAFGGGVPMGGAGLQTASRQLGGNLSFAQSVSGGSQPTAPLDLSREFPSLSNNSHLSSTNQSSMWSAGGSRAMGGSIQRNQPTPLSAQHDEMFSPASRINSSQPGYRYGTQSSQASQPQPNSIDEFPPLNNSFRNGSDLGQERGQNLMSTLGFGAQGSAAPGSIPGTRTGNGLLNALSANSRATETRSPDVTAAPGNGRPQDMRSVSGSDEPRQKPPGFRDDPLPKTTGRDPLQMGEGRNPLGAIGSNDASSSKAKEELETQSSDVHDPLNGLSDIDKWGLKGLRTLMHNHPDYSLAMTGVDPSSFGLDMQSPGPMTTQIYSLLSDVPPRPAIPNFHVPDCYLVNNVQPLEHKISNFNEETLMWIFYSCCGDVKQQMAALELNNRNWRWHKKLKIWLTKDELMHPRVLSSQHEEGYYIIWNTTEWRKERRTMTLHYADLETNSGGVPPL